MKGLTLFPHQKQFIESQAKVTVMHGGCGTGKTFALNYAICEYMKRDHAVAHGAAFVINPENYIKSLMQMAEWRGEQVSKSGRIVLYDYKSLIVEDQGWLNDRKNVQTMGRLIPIWLDISDIASKRTISILSKINERYKDCLHIRIVCAPLPEDVTGRMDHIDFIKVPAISNPHAVEEAFPHD